MSTLKGSIEAVRRKLRALDAVTDDKAATESERANAEALRARFEQRLKEAGEPASDWTDRFFRLGRQVKELRGSSNGDWTVGAFRLGRALRRGYKKWSSD
jgi:hypothetical protein